MVNPATLLGILCLLFLPDPGGGQRLTRGPFKKVVIVNGQIVAGRAERILVPRTSNWRIEIKWMAEEGSVVAAGDPVIRFDNSGLIDEMQNLETELESKESEQETKLADAANKRYEKEVALKEATIQFEKTKLKADIPADLLEAREHQENQLALTKAEKALEAARLDQKTTIANLESELAILELDLNRKRAARERLLTTLQALEIKVQSEGIVIYENNPWEGHKLQAGDTVQTGWSVLHIPDLSSLLVESFVSETELNFLEIGQTATMTLDAYPDRSYTGKISEISRKGTTRNQWGSAPYFRVRIALDEQDAQRMRPGMSMRAEIVVVDSQEALLAPLQLVRLTDEGWWIRPTGGEPLKVEPIGYNAFYLALPVDDRLAVGTTLEAVGDIGGS